MKVVLMKVVFMNLYFTQQHLTTLVQCCKAWELVGQGFNTVGARTRHENLPWMPTAVHAPEKDQPALHAVTNEAGRLQDDAGGSRDALFLLVRIEAQEGHYVRFCDTHHSQLRGKSP